MLSVSSGCTLYPTSTKITIVFTVRQLHKQEINFRIFFFSYLWCAINQPKMLWLKILTIYYLFYELSWLLRVVLLFCVSLFGVSHLAIVNWQSGWVEGSNKASLTLLGGLSPPGGLFTYLRWVSSQHVGLRDFTWQFTVAFEIQAVKAVSSLIFKTHYHFCHLILVKVS